MLASKNIQPIGSCQVTLKVMIQVQPCGIGNEELVARKKGEHYMSSYKDSVHDFMSSWEEIKGDYVDQSCIEAPIIQIQIQKSEETVTNEVYIRSNQSKQNRQTYIQNQFIILSLLSSTL